MTFFEKDIVIHMTQSPGCEFGTWVASIEALEISEMGISQREAFRNACDKVIELMSPNIKEDPIRWAQEHSIPEEVIEKYKKDHNI